MENVRNVAFRSAISGYNRDDVNRYILEMNREFEGKEEGYRKQTDELRSLAEEKEQQILQASEQITELQRTREEAEHIIAALREQNDQLKAQKEMLNEKVLKAELRADTAEEKLCNTKEQLLQLKNDITQSPVNSDADEKSKKYDQISAQIGDIMIGASSSAEKIIAAANTEAGRIVAETEAEAVYIRTRLSDTADEMLNNISECLHNSTELCIAELLTSLREMKESTSALIRDFERRNRELEEKIEYYKANVTDTVENSLSEMDEKYGIKKKQ